MADFTKDGAVVDEWAEIAAGVIRPGADIAVPEDIGIDLELTICHSSSNAHANGALVIVEVSSNTSGDEDWTELLPGGFRSSGGSSADTTIDIESGPGTSLWLLATSGFENKMGRFFIEEGTPANSEIGRVSNYAVGDSVAPVDGLTRTHIVGVHVFSIVEQWPIRVPKEFRRARVLVWNDDADCTIFSRTRKALATDIV